MLSSDDKRFQWAKKDRSREPTLFRQLIQNWQPTVRFDPPTRSGRPAKPQRSKAAWSPWLWIKERY